MLPRAPLGEVLLAEVKHRRLAEAQIKELLQRIISAQEIERQRIARDLHDHLGQELTALRFNLEVLKEQCAVAAETCERIEKTQEIARRIKDAVDFLAWELRPTALDHLGLAAAVDNFVREWTKHYGVASEFHASGLDGVRLLPEVETNLYRVMQEALNNIAKYDCAYMAAHKTN